jgi:hypothetical protein
VVVTTARTSSNLPMQRMKHTAKQRSLITPLDGNFRTVKKNQVIDVVEIAIHKLLHVESLYKQVNDEVNKQQYND